MQHVEINGAPPTVAQLYRAATINFGHFTSMQVRDRAVRGLDLHLLRLRDATRELFGTGLVDADIKNFIKHALLDHADASIRVTVFPSTRDLSAAETAPPDIMVTVTDPVSDALQPPWAVRSAHYVREMPHVKHVATMGLIQHWRAAVRDGFDDAVFLDENNRISEGSAWNITFWDGSGFVWPQAAQLSGITMQLLKNALPQVGLAVQHRAVQRDELSSFCGAVATYSHCPAQPIARVDDVLFGGNEEAVRALRLAWDRTPFVAL